MNRAVLLVSILLYATSAPPPAGSEPFYTIDSALEELLIIESATGQIVQDVGGLYPGVDILTIRSIATRDTREFYGIFEMYGPWWRLFRISRTTGQMLQPGYTLFDAGIAEGLAFDSAGWWWLSYSTVSTASDHLGKFFYPDDSVIDVGPLQTAAGVPLDGDEIRFGLDGTLYLVDALCCGNGTNIYSLSGTTGTLLVHCEEYSYISSVEFDGAGRLVFMDEAADVIGTISLADGAVASVVPLPSSTLTGLARAAGIVVGTAPVSWGLVKAQYR